MSSFDYAKLAATAMRLLTKFGSLGVVGDGSAARNVMMARLKVENHPLLDSNINVGDFYYIVGPQTDTGVDPDPQEGERMSFKGEEMNIVEVHKFKPDAIVLYYEVWGRLG